MFWQDLSPEDQGIVEAAGVRRRWEAGSYLFFEGDHTSHVIVILSGRLKLTTTTPDGRAVIIEFREEGEIIGELAAIDLSPRSSAAVASTDLEGLVINDETFRELIVERGSIGLAVLKTAADKIRETSQRRLESGTKDAVRRVAGRLVELADRQEREPNGSLDLQNPITQQEMAEWIGASRDAVVLAMRQLRTLNLVETGRQRVMILDVDALRRFASAA